MTADLTAALGPWHDFFDATAGASAVLLGLVFIGLTIHLEGRKEEPMLVPLAIGSATTLFYPVVISLLLLMPPAQPWLPTAVLVVLSLFASVSSAAPILDADLRSLWLGRRRLRDMLRFGIPLFAALVLIPASIALLWNAPVALYAVGTVIVVFIVVGTQTAWNLLLAGRFEVGAWGVSRTTPPDGSK